MAVVMDHPVDDENAPVIHGRPDFGRKGFGVTLAKKHPPFVFGIRGASCVVHQVRRVELHWYRCGNGGRCLVKLKKPCMIAITRCAQIFRLDGDISRTCHIPNPDAVPCGRCAGDVAPFGKHGAMTKAGVKRQEAHVKLGCVIAGY